MLQPVSHRAAYETTMVHLLAEIADCDERLNLIAAERDALFARIEYLEEAAGQIANVLASTQEA